MLLTEDFVKEYDTNGQGVVKAGFSTADGWSWYLIEEFDFDIIVGCFQGKRFGYLISGESELESEIYSEYCAADMCETPVCSALVLKGLKDIFLSSMK